MAKKTKHSTSEIQRLIGEKRQIEQWLARLDVAGDKTPGKVRDRVRRDYQKRLDAVVEELGGYRDELTSTLDEHRERRESLAGDEADATARLAEAELRHTVGEYDEAKWDGVRTEHLDALVHIRDDLKAEDDEIASLEEILAAFDEPAASEEAEEEPVEATDEGEEEEVEEEEELEPIEDEDEETAGRASGQTDAFDELAFLKSVTDMVPPKGGKKAQAKKESSAERAPRGQPKPQKGTADKTVKCGECGALNLPTEWYCERCGAELTAV